MITDADYLLEQLRLHPSGRDAMQVISASIRDRGVGLTVHSRAASLRDQGYVISCGIEGKTRKGRERYVYRLISEPEKCEPGADHPVNCAPAVRASHQSTAVKREQQPRSGDQAAAPLDAPIPGQLRLIA